MHNLVFLIPQTTISCLSSKSGYMDYVLIKLMFVTFSCC